MDYDSQRKSARVPGKLSSHWQTIMKGMPISIFHFKNRNFYVKKLEIYFYKEIFLVRRLENYYKDLMIYISIFACEPSKGALD